MKVSVYTPKMPEHVALIIAGTMQSFNLTEREAWDLFAREYRKRLPKLIEDAAATARQRRQERQKVKVAA